ncbi:MAG: PQQ-binding-like beta-propeller repeat protein [Armatimonadota bacterium]
MTECDVPRGRWTVVVTLLIAAALVVIAMTASCQQQTDAQDAATVADAPPLPAEVTEAPADRWARFRGSVGSGVAQFDELPTVWDAETGEGIVWSIELPLPGANSPVIWQDRLFVTGADEHRREVYCLDAHTGELRWTLPVAEGEDWPVERMHSMTGHAAPTGATDGERIYECFPTGHVIAADFGGELAWERWFDFSDDIYGRATSLVLHDGLIFVQIDLGKPDIGESHMVALDAATGDTVWEIERPVQGSWTTPIVIDTGEREELITSAKPWVIAYDPATGEEYWRARCIEGDSAPSPIYANGRIYVANIYAELTAIIPGGSGDVTRTHIDWSVRGQFPDITSPLSNGELVWTLHTSGMLGCYDADTGEEQYTERLRSRFRASPSLAGNHVYLIEEAGEGIVIAEGRQFERLGSGTFSEDVHSTPSFAHGRMYVRGMEHLFCVGSGE